jgi:hypothetical protein
MFSVPRHVLNCIKRIKRLRSYTSLSHCTLSEAIEVVEEFLNTDLSLEDLSLHALFNV